ncbi:peptide chain release factor 1 [Kamptonema sp. UHCC 0994]|uniref:peptide chain release factor 1 n=1 Tax=Kamptonema sp. UHCC 0994 TaxID=3031329 RepID=UPI0023B92267|nr:peptide chain release factor 1 [Kamptonema sp. UHCC 0994]MDF0554770.1 peptide chain release factor 1 [Kamptonema sp. UHCC 0994]
MSNPLGRLKNLPWRELLQIAALTNLIVIGLDLFLWWGFTQSPIVRNILKLLYGSSLGVLIPVVTAVGMGALAVYLFEQRQQQFLLNGSSLWALVVCLLVGLAFKSFLSLPAFLVDLSETTLIGIVIGVFWKGRPYWR